MKFEWDDQKAIENLAKHGVSFGEATEVFYDPNAVEIEDAEHSFRRTAFCYHWIFEQSNSPRRLC